MPADVWPQEQRPAAGDQDRVEPGSPIPELARLGDDLVRQRLQRAIDDRGQTHRLAVILDLVTDDRLQDLVVAQLQIWAMLIQPDPQAPHRVPRPHAHRGGLPADLRQAIHPQQVRRLAADVDHAHRPGGQDLVDNAAATVKGCGQERAKGLRDHPTVGDLEDLRVPSFSLATMIAEETIAGYGATPAFKGYVQPGKQPYPATICASVDCEVVHGIPGDRALEEGQIVSVDVGARLEAFYGDQAATFPVGNVGTEAEELVRATEKALEIGVEKARAGLHLGDLSHAIEEWAEETNPYHVVRSYTGHGLGRRLHEDPQIPNFGPPGKGPVLQSGMVLAIEPMVNAGTYDVLTLKDNWTFVTVDGKLSAHFEDTVAITDNGPVILTR